MELITLIVPCYNEEASLPYFYDEVIRVEKKLPEDTALEFLFIDDGSSDKTMKVIKSLRLKDKRVHYVSFSRNFGKEAAIFAGFSHGNGDYMAVLDADLQDPPALLPEMLRLLKEDGYDCAGTRRVTREGEPPIRSFFARVFYRSINMISSTKLVDGARDYRLMKRSVVEALLSLPEYNRFSKGLYEWVGFKTKWLEYKNVERVAGETKWSFWKLFKYSLEGIVAFSVIPLSLASALGVFFCVISFISICALVVRQLIWHASVSGWTSMVSIIIFMGGIQLFCTGILGQYLSKTYLETKKRPIYVAREIE